jgi:serine/threonine protein phosphatase PrpC
VGQISTAGRKPINEDSCGIRIPESKSELTHKGIVAITADGVGSSEEGREAAEQCVLGFIYDYYSTPDSWSVKTSGHKVIRAINAWLYSQAQRRGLGMASTIALVVLKSTSAHLFHVGDSRIWLLRNKKLRQLTRDHRILVDQGNSWLARAMGGDHEVQVDYDRLLLEERDRLLLTTDGVHEWLDSETLRSLAEENRDPEDAAQCIVQAALEAGSVDNLTCQVLDIISLPDMTGEEFHRRLTERPFPPPLSPGMTLDGYHILRELHASPTVQIYLAEDRDGRTVVLKTPSVQFEDDPTYIDRFVHEEWIGRRIDHPNVFKVLEPAQKPRYLYYVGEYLKGQSLAQWILDHPEPDLGQVRDIAHQLIAGLRAFHRKEMVHLDIKPENIMIDRHNRVKIIDFGSTYVAGLKEIYVPIEHSGITGTANYIAPELFDGFTPTPKCDMYSLGVTLYEMLSGGHLPYGNMDKAQKLRHYDYTSLRRYNVNVPVWIDGAIRRAVHPDPDRRYDSFSEFETDLNQPNPTFMTAQKPLLERNPLGFWRGLTILLIILNLILLFLLAK